MAEFRDRTFSDGEIVDVDDNRFIDCRFDNAQLRYAGGEHPHFENCQVEDIGWYFTGAALRTIQLLQAQNIEGQAQAMLEVMFKPGNYYGE
jgi:uncharacterized protein YjbI with pentapeptide repeats